MSSSPAWPGEPDKALVGLPTQLLLAVPVGIVAALVSGEPFGGFRWGLAVLAGVLVGVLLIQSLTRRFLSAVELPDVEPSPAKLTDSITSSRRAAYAISSNWLSLWRSPTFRYYLHLDVAMSLVAYSDSTNAALERLSSDEKDLEDFYQEGWRLVRSVASGNYPLERHRIRLLIYPAEAYRRYRLEVQQLIASHAAGRIPCIPLVAEVLQQGLTGEEVKELNELTGSSGLGQDVFDKLPPVSRWERWYIARKLRRGGRHELIDEWPVFPDMLLVDAPPDEQTTVWWYTSAGSVENWQNTQSNKIDRASTVFRTLCREAKRAEWKDYSCKILERVPVSSPQAALISEAFFSRSHYQSWLAWAETEAETVPQAKTLRDWLKAETVALENFVQQYLLERSTTTSGSASLLDVGCGFGRHMNPLLEQHAELEAVGVDINSTMVELATHDARIRGIASRVMYLRQDASRLAGCRDEEFDLAICMTNTLGNMREGKRRELMVELRRVLRPGGKLLISVYARDSREARLASYRSIGLHVKETGSLIEATEGLVSTSFEAADVYQLAQQSGFQMTGSIKPLGGPMGWIATVTR